MKTNSNISRGVLHFSCWSRKGYAIFAALGQQVHISSLSIGVCVCALLKSASKGLITTTVACGEFCFPIEEIVDRLGIYTYRIVAGNETYADSLASAVKMN